MILLISQVRKFVKEHLTHKESKLRNWMVLHKCPFIKSTLCFLWKIRLCFFASQIAKLEKKTYWQKAFLISYELRTLRAFCNGFTLKRHLDKILLIKIQYCCRYNTDCDGRLNVQFDSYSSQEDIDHLGIVQSYFCFRVVFAGQKLALAF